MSEQAHGPEQDPTPVEMQESGEVHEAATHEGEMHVEKWEGIWIRLSVVMVVIFIVGIVIASASFGITVPGATGRINPNTLNEPGNPFAEPGIRELAPGKYEVYMVAQTWNFLPAQIEVPAGSEVTFYLTSRDVVHGFKVADTNVNMMAIPGQIGTLKANFDTPGTYNFICHEYCGYVAGSPPELVGHQAMYGQLTVLPPAESDSTAQATTE